MRIQIPPSAPSIAPHRNRKSEVRSYGWHFLLEGIPVFSGFPFFVFWVFWQIWRRLPEGALHHEPSASSAYSAPQRIRVAMIITNTAKMRFRVTTGVLCDNLAPKGAVKKLKRAMPKRAGM